MMLDTREPYRVVEAFERALEAYTGAPHVVAVDSCTNALFLCFQEAKLDDDWDRRVTLPKHTYVGVAQAARNAGLIIEWSDKEWLGRYEIEPIGVVDSAKWFYEHMYADTPGKFVCLSFQAAKTLPIGRGGAILTDDAWVADRLRRMRFDGREPGKSLDEQENFGRGWHMHLAPPDAARGLWLLSWAKKYNEPQRGEYPNLSEKEWT